MKFKNETVFKVFKYKKREVKKNNDGKMKENIF